MIVTRQRMAIAVLALGGIFLSLYLFLFSLGVYGELACGGSGGCDFVQASVYSRFLGLPVSGWGLAWYVAVFGTAMIAIRPRFADERWPGLLLLGLATSGLAFSAYLTFLELFVIHAICRWCVGSAALTVFIFLLVLPLGGRARGAAPV